MNSIRKLFNALNSSGKSWQLSAAIVLAMFGGFLPTSSLILFDLLFLALVLNVNFGLFLMSFVVFSGLGYLFDPIFESIGYSVLTQDSLNGIFTSMYNSPIFRWSEFNYTLVTGSLVVSSILAIPMMLILNKLITLYRDKIGQKLNEWRFTKWMNLFNDEVTSISLFRWWGLGVFGGLASIIVIFILFVFDPLARIAMEKGLSYSLKTQVSVKDFSSSFTDLHVKISGIEVADKDMLSHNLVQLSDIEFDLGFSALLEKKAMIEKLNVKALSFNTKREVPATAYDDSYVSSSEEAVKDDDKDSSIISNPFSVPSVDDILAKEELASIKEAQKLKADIQTTKDKWAKVSKDLKNQTDLKEIKAEAKDLQDSLKNADVAKILSAKSKIDSIQSKVKALKNKYSSLQKEFNADQKRLKNKIYELKNLPQKDIKRLKDKYSLDASGGANIIGTLVNDEVGSYMNTALKYYDMLSPYLNDSKKKELEDKAPARGEGRWIKYVNMSNTPDLIIKESNINILFSGDVLDLHVKDISSNQKLYKKPMVLKGNARGKRYKSILIDVVDDRRSNIAYTSFDMRAMAFRTDNLDMKTLNMKDILTNANFKGSITGTDIKAKSLVNVKDVKLQMPSQKIVNSLLSGISKFNLSIALNGNIKKPSIKVSSDLNKQLQSGMSSLVSDATKDFQKDLTAGVMKKVSGSSDGISADLGDVGSLLNSNQNALGGINTNFSPAGDSGVGGLINKFF
ncbi:TIGR03545 family protein [Sulfurimonas sp.]|nr:TIGR03545 family protein [Sulfurimonas sp.]